MTFRSRVIQRSSPGWPDSAWRGARVVLDLKCVLPCPPRPPRPLGPPRGTYFSLRKLTTPLPPSPPLTKTVTRSTNMAHPAVPAANSLRGRGPRRLGQRDDVDPPAAPVERHRALDQREDRP